MLILLHIATTTAYLDEKKCELFSCLGLSLKIKLNILVYARRQTGKERLSLCHTVWPTD